MLKRILLVLQREYLSRVKKRSFIVMTILTPLLIALFYGVVFYIFYSQEKAKQSKAVCVFDASGYFTDAWKSDARFTFTFRQTDFDTTYDFEADGYDACLVLAPPDSGVKKYSAVIYSKESLSLIDQGALEVMIEDKLFDDNLKNLKITGEQLKEANVKVNLDARQWSQGHIKQSNSGASTGIGLAASILIYLFIFLYGNQVMRGVVEEKTNRIVEVIISSVKPFELMMGKILGIALVALTQMALWVVLSSVATGAVTGILSGGMHLNDATGPMMPVQGPNPMQSNFLNIITSLPLGTMGISFMLYFLFGYLFYASLFAAIGSAVDSETDLQQFTFPVSLPLVFSFILTQAQISSSPNGPMLMWMSMIPFSSPVAMMARIPFMEESSYWQIVVSVVLLIASFIGSTWVAARIYRTGILMYGKKATWKELWKWLIYRGN